MFETNSLGNKRNGYVKKEAYRGLIIGPTFSLLMIFLTYLSMSKWIVFFYVTSPFLVMLMLLKFVYAPILMLKRHNRTICSIGIDNENITIETFQALWIKSKKDNFKKDTLQIKTTKFNWYGKVTKEGVSIQAGKHKYYLIKDYFTNYEDIKKKLFNS